MTSKIISILTLAFLFSFFSNLSHGKDEVLQTKSRQRIEELYKWKVSDQLGLTAKEEEEFLDIFKDLNEQKRNLSKKNEDLLKDLSTAKDTKAKEKILATYEKNQDDLAKLSKKECKSLKKLFGTNRFAQYLVLKNDLTAKLKDYLSGHRQMSSDVTSKETDLKMKEPQVIEAD